VVLPKARYEWIHLRLQDFKSVGEYNSTIFRITSELKLCGEKITNEDMFEKIFFTFHASNFLLQQQYRERGFKKYSELISRLLVAEQNNEFLMKNHQSRPTDFSPFPEANATAFSEANAISFERNHSRRRGRGPRRGRGRGRNNIWRRESHNSKSNDNNVGRYEKEKNSPSSKKSESSCYRCGMINYWSRTCRTLKYLVELYQASIKKKGKEVETNFIENESSGILMDTHLDVSDFFENVDKEIDIMN
jgi:hypothetical protein